MTQNDTSTHAADLGVLSVSRLMHEALVCRECGRPVEEHDTVRFLWRHDQASWVDPERTYD